MLLSIFYDAGRIFALGAEAGQPLMTRSLCLGLDAPLRFNKILGEYILQEFPSISPSSVLVADFAALQNLDFPYVWFGLPGIYSSLGNLPIASWEEVFSWLEKEWDFWNLTNYVGNRYLYPAYTPSDPLSWGQEETFFWLLFRFWRQKLAGKLTGWPESLKSLVFSSRFLGLDLPLGQKIFPLLEAAPEQGLVEVFLDVGNYLPCLGMLANVNRDLYQESLEKLALIRAAAVFRALGPLVVEIDFGARLSGQTRISKNGLEVFPLSTHDVAQLAVRLADGRLVPPFEVRGGELGLIVDGRSSQLFSRKKEQANVWRRRLSQRRFS